jgi:hypothetical protein
VADAASISGFSIDTAAACSCDGSTWEAERLSARIFNPLVGGVICCCGRFFFMMVVQESKKSPLNALALQRRIANPNVKVTVVSQDNEEISRIVNKSLDVRKANE